MTPLRKEGKRGNSAKSRQQTLWGFASHSAHTRKAPGGCGSLRSPPSPEFAVKVGSPGPSEQAGEWPSQGRRGSKPLEAPLGLSASPHLVHPTLPHSRLEGYSAEPPPPLPPGYPYPSTHPSLGSLTINTEVQIKRRPALHVRPETSEVRLRLPWISCDPGALRVQGEALAITSGSQSLCHLTCFHV